MREIEDDRDGSFLLDSRNVSISLIEGLSYSERVNSIYRHLRIRLYVCTGVEQGGALPRERGQARKGMCGYTLR